MKYACIKSGQIVNVIVADEAFINAATDFTSQYDSVVSLAGLIPEPGINWSYDGNAFTDNRVPQLDMEAVIKLKIQSAILFGQKLLDDFATENVLAGITQAGKTGAVSDTLHKLSHYVGSGSLYEALNEIARLIVNGLDPNLAPFVTVARLTDYSNRIRQYLGI